MKTNEIIKKRKKENHSFIHTETTKHIINQSNKKQTYTKQTKKENKQNQFYRHTRRNPKYTLLNRLIHMNYFGVRSRF